MSELLVDIGVDNSGKEEIPRCYLLHKASIGTSPLGYHQNIRPNSISKCDMSDFFTNID